MEPKERQEQKKIIKYTYEELYLLKKSKLSRTNLRINRNILNYISNSQRRTRSYNNRFIRKRHNSNDYGRKSYSNQKSNNWRKNPSPSYKNTKKDGRTERDYKDGRRISNNKNGKKKNAKTEPKLIRGQKNNRKKLSTSAPTEKEKEQSLLNESEFLRNFNFIEDEQTAKSSVDLDEILSKFTPHNHLSKRKESKFFTDKKEDHSDVLFSSIDKDFEKKNFNHVENVNQVESSWIKDLEKKNKNYVIPVIPKPTTYFNFKKQYDSSKDKDIEGFEVPTSSTMSRIYSMTNNSKGKENYFVQTKQMKKGSSMDQNEDKSDIGVNYYKKKDSQSKMMFNNMNSILNESPRKFENLVSNGDKQTIETNFELNNFSLESPQNYSDPVQMNYFMNPNLSNKIRENSKFIGNKKFDVLEPGFTSEADIVNSIGKRQNNEIGQRRSQSKFLKLINRSNDENGALKKRFTRGLFHTNLSSTTDEDKESKFTIYPPSGIDESEVVNTRTNSRVNTRRNLKGENVQYERKDVSSKTFGGAMDGYNYKRNFSSIFETKKKDFFNNDSPPIYISEIEKNY